MKNAWNFKIELESKNVFDEISEKYDIDIPEELREFIIENNAASPDANCVNINGVERVYSETLSFNMEETEATTFISVMDAINDQNYIPFALDPFGNVFCYSVEDKTISFYDHESDDIEDTNVSLTDFLDSLH